MRLTLQDIGIGERVRVSGHERGTRAIRERLLALGLTRGTDVTLVRAAPAGGPLEIHARDTALALRRSEAATVHVERVVATA